MWSLHFHFSFFSFHFSFIISRGVLVVLILSDEIRKVGLSFSEFHLVHSFSGVPMKEGLSSEHDSELFSDSLEHLLDGGGVTNESDGHLKSLRRNIADSRLDVVGDPLDEVGVVL